MQIKSVKIKIPRFTAFRILAIYLSSGYKVSALLVTFDEGNSNSSINDYECAIGEAATEFQVSRTCRIIDPFLGLHIRD
jgi:hypothetical protein